MLMEVMFFAGTGGCGIGCDTVCICGTIWAKQGSALCDCIHCTSTYTCNSIDSTTGACLKSPAILISLSIFCAASYEGPISLVDFENMPSLSLKYLLRSCVYSNDASVFELVREIRLTWAMAVCLLSLNLPITYSYVTSFSFCFSEGSYVTLSSLLHGLDIKCSYVMSTLLWPLI